jgi:hypothetical protein
MTETSISLFPRRVRRKLVPLGGVHLKIGSVGTKARAIEALHFGKTTTIEELSFDIRELNVILMDMLEKAFREGLKKKMKD